MRPAVFLDRDGTLLEEMGYLTPASALLVFPWTIDAIRLFNQAGYAAIVVTNQGGIGRGLYTAEFVEQTHASLAARLAAGGARVDAWQYCPHHPDALIAGPAGPCACRKPEPGMVAAAAEQCGPFDLSRSWTIGDQWRDVQLGHAIGARSILVRSGHGADQERSWPPDIALPTMVCDNLIAACAAVVSFAAPDR